MYKYKPIGATDYLVGWMTDDKHWTPQRRVHSQEEAERICKLLNKWEDTRELDRPTPQSVYDGEKHHEG